MKPLKILKNVLLLVFLAALSACLEDETIPADDFLDPLASAQHPSDIFLLNENAQTIVFKANFLSEPIEIAPWSQLLSEDQSSLDFTAEGSSSHYFFTQVDLNSKLFTTGKPPWENKGIFYLIDPYGNKLPASFKGEVDRFSNTPLSSHGGFVIKPGNGKYKNLRGEGRYEIIVIPNPSLEKRFVKIEFRIEGVFTILAPGYFGDN